MAQKVDKRRKKRKAARERAAKRRRQKIEHDATRCIEQYRRTARSWKALVLRAQHGFDITSAATELRDRFEKRDLLVCRTVHPEVRYVLNQLKG